MISPKGFGIHIELNYIYIIYYYITKICMIPKIFL